MTKKIITCVLALVLALTLMLFSACGNSDNPDTPDNGNNSNNGNTSIEEVLKTDAGKAANAFINGITSDLKQAKYAVTLVDEYALKDNYNRVGRNVTDFNGAVKLNSDATNSDVSWFCTYAYTSFDDDDFINNNLSIDNAFDSIETFVNNNKDKASYSGNDGAYVAHDADKQEFYYYQPSNDEPSVDTDEELLNMFKAYTNLANNKNILTDDVKNLLIQLFAGVDLDVALKNITELDGVQALNLLKSGIAWIKTISNDIYGMEEFEEVVNSISDAALKGISIVNVLSAADGYLQTNNVNISATDIFNNFIGILSEMCNKALNFSYENNTLTIKFNYDNFTDYLQQIYDDATADIEITGYDFIDQVGKNLTDFYLGTDGDKLVDEAFAFIAKLIDQKVTVGDTLKQIKNELEKKNMDFDEIISLITYYDSSLASELNVNNTDTWGELFRVESGSEMDSYKAQFKQEMHRYFYYRHGFGLPIDYDDEIDGYSYYGNYDITVDINISLTSGGTLDKVTVKYDYLYEQAYKNVNTNTEESRSYDHFSMYAELTDFNNTSIDPVSDFNAKVAASQEN